jgi:hypothetical protein
MCCNNYKKSRATDNARLIDIKKKKRFKERERKNK